MVGQSRASRDNLFTRDYGQSRVPCETSHRQSKRRLKEKIAFPRGAGLAMTNFSHA